MNKGLLRILISTLVVFSTSFWRNNGNLLLIRLKVIYKNDRDKQTNKRCRIKSSSYHCIDFNRTSVLLIMAMALIVQFIQAIGLFKIWDLNMEVCLIKYHHYGDHK